MSTFNSLIHNRCGTKFELIKRREMVSSVVSRITGLMVKVDSSHQVTCHNVNVIVSKGKIDRKRDLRYYSVGEKY